ncbi:hypothetical protein AAEX28_08315 [Lentisphaerota bacterium WC36G]|nr:hypothetical protein LJT99_11170 [Lentisphaerae bacterium WC36]
MNTNNQQILESIKQQNISCCNSSNIKNKLEAIVKQYFSKSNEIKEAMEAMSCSDKYLNSRANAIKNAKKIIKNWQIPSDDAMNKIAEQLVKKLCG